MEPVVLVFLSTAVGTVVGVACAVLMMQRRTRVPAAEGGAAGKGPQNLATVVAAPNVTIDDVRKLLAERDQTLQQCRDDLEKRQQQLELATTAIETATGLRAEAEQRNTDLTAQVAAFSEQLRELSAKTKEGGAASEESGRRITVLESQLELERAQGRDSAEQAATLTSELARYKTAGAEAVTQLEAQLEAEKQTAMELSGQVARLTSELTAFRVGGSDAIVQLETQLEAERRHIQELVDQVGVLSIDLSQARQYGADADGYRSTLETELGVNRLRIQQLTDQLAEINGEVEAQLDVKDRESRDLTEQMARLSSELTEYRSASAEAVAQLQEQISGEKHQNSNLSEQVAALTADLAHAKQYGADADAYRSSIEAELGIGRLRIMQLTDQIAELNRDRSQFEVRLREERQSAARGIELLSLAQSTLSGALNRLKEEQQVDDAMARAASTVAPAEPLESPIVEMRIEDELISEPEELISEPDELISEHEELVSESVGASVGVSA